MAVTTRRNIPGSTTVAPTTQATQGMSPPRFNTRSFPAYTGPMSETVTPTTQGTVMPPPVAPTMPIATKTIPGIPTTQAPTQPPLAKLGEDVLRDSLTGDIYNPYRLQQQQAINRFETNQRATAAAGIHRAGFAGTPVGAMYGNATEGELARNRFEQHIGLETDKNNLRLQAAGEVNRFEAERMAIEQGRYDLARSNFSEFVLTHPELEDAFASGNEEAISQWMNNPQFRAVAEKYFGGDFTSGQAATAVNNLRISSSGREMSIREFMSMGLSLEDAETVVNKEQLRAAGFEFDGKTGEFVELDEQDRKVAQRDIAQNIRDGNINLSTYIFEDGVDDPVYQMLLSGMPDGYGSQRLEGKRKGTQTNVFGIGRATNPGRTQYTKLEQAHSDGTAIKINGTLYYVQNVNRTNGHNIHGNVWMSGFTIYTLVCPITGKPETVKSSGERVTF